MHDSWLAGNGKQALSIAASVLRDAGFHTVIVPRYRCDAMVVPFELEGFHVAYAACGPDLLLDPDALLEAVYREGRAVVLHCETFGNRANRELRSALGQVRAAGGCVILDATHSILTRPSLLTGHLPEGPWDMAIASLRKLLPVPDAAVLAWSDRFAPGMVQAYVAASQREPDEEISRLGWEAAVAEQELRRLRARSLPGRAAGGAVRSAVVAASAAAQRHEDAIELALTPRPASRESQAFVGPLTVRTVDDFRRRRARNARYLLSALGRFGSGLQSVGNPWAGWVALRGRADGVDNLLEQLDQAGLWGPALWERPEGEQATTPWPAILTLPTARTADARAAAALVGKQRFDHWAGQSRQYPCDRSKISLPQSPCWSASATASLGC